jgi:hypothetical protein
VKHGIGLITTQSLSSQTLLIRLPKEYHLRADTLIANDINSFIAKEGMRLHNTQCNLQFLFVDYNA